MLKFYDFVCKIPPMRVVQISPTTRDNAQLLSSLVPISQCVVHILYISHKVWTWTTLIYFGHITGFFFRIVFTGYVSLYSSGFLHLHWCDRVIIQKSEMQPCELWIITRMEPGQNTMVYNLLTNNPDEYSFNIS